MAATSRSTGVMVRVCGNVRSIVTPATQGFCLSDSSIAAVSTLRSVVPSGTSTRRSAISCDTCSLPFTTTSLAAKIGEFATTTHMTTAATSATAEMMPMRAMGRPRMPARAVEAGVRADPFEEGAAPPCSAAVMRLVGFRAGFAGAP